ncbi:transmembrane protein 220-like [Exaiptasia diaphana]|uniref:Transmembrane protein 220 n=1 Tax=Exaiptasia diaphana TaxID=2652724 RepID=A0A913X569_EXADI|nr:transmembrane protein 220-like [Exaiptasia diaphana]
MMTEYKINSLPSYEVPSCFPWLWRAANGIMSIFLALATYVQINDPDPAIWMAVYGIPCFLCTSICIYPPVIKTFLWKALSVSHLTACIVGAMYLSMSVSKHMRVESMNPLTHEEGRELCGLTVVITWLAVCQLLTIKRCAEFGPFNCTYTWSIFAVIAMIPFVLWCVYLNTLDKDSLPGHCKNLILQ